MNREIEFRAWILAENKMLNNGDWFMLDLTYPCYAIQYAEQGFYVNNANAQGEHLEHLKKHNIEPIDEFVLMQYTGLKDKNGVKIFEGDVLKWVSSNPFSKGEIRKVRVYYIQAQFWCKGTIGVYLAELLSAEKCEVIGNIHSNPELINC